MAKWRRQIPQLLASGIYKVHLIAAHEEKSKAEDDMIVLTLAVEGEGAAFKEWIVIAANWEKKIAAFLSAFGETLPDEGEIIAENYIGRTAHVEIGVRTDKNGRTFNKVSRWQPLETESQPTSAKEEV